MLHWLSKFFKGFVYAYHGILRMLRERNMQVHIFAAFIVITAGLFFHLSRIEWAVIVLTIVAVMGMEMVNTAIEEVCNVLRDTLSVSYAGTRVARDVAAGAVLVVAIGAAVIGLLIFGPKLLSLLH